MSYQSKYTGAQVEDALDKAKTAVQPEELKNKQDVIADLDAIRSGAAKGATAVQDINHLATKEELKGKVDKVDGKQLSTEDFTTALKNKLNGLSNYDDTAISNALDNLRSDFDTLVSGDTTNAIKTFNEVIAFLDGISDSEDLDSIIASIEQQIAGKYSKPSSGIPKTDLSSNVQESLNKADSALQEEQYKGTISAVDAVEIVDDPTFEGGSYDDTEIREQIAEVALDVRQVHLYVQR